MNSIEEWLNRPGGLARRLRSHRRSARLTGSQVARELGWTQSKVSKIETGKQMPTEDDILGWAQACHIGADESQALTNLLSEAQGLHQEWRQQVRLGQATIQRNYNELAARSTTIRNVEIIYIPGLLQTAEYARCRIEEGVRLHGADPDEVQVATAQRMSRQQILYDTSKTFEFVITEAALRLLLCPAPAMLAQLDRLLSLTGLPHIKLGIIPFGVLLPTAPQNSFILFDDDLAIVESFVGETMHHGDEAIAFRTAIDNLLSEAYFDSDARQLILRAAEKLRSSL
ncbi:helix-turn-helix domain-containing protein [Micromonospora sp. NPDC050397]|uniref:helix-turn-helix domain-containing protein n=1 Tax=Micromonospora sp. NPDC050397 TaxID=3364279 RepID=UPI00384D755B